MPKIKSSSIASARMRSVLRRTQNKKIHNIVKRIYIHIAYDQNLKILYTVKFIKIYNIINLAFKKNENAHLSTYVSVKCSIKIRML